MFFFKIEKKRKKRTGDMTISELRIDSAVSNMAESLCLCRDSAFVLAPGAALHPGESEVIEGHGEGFPRGVTHPSSAPQPVGLPLERAGTSAERGTPPVSFGASPDDQMSIAALEGELSLSGDDDPAALPPSGVVALSEPDPEMTAMLSRAAENVGLVWKKKSPLRPDPLRLDEWFLGGGRAGSQRPPLVPFFPEVHEELKRSWKAPFTARNKSCSSSPLTTLDGGAALGYVGIPLVERSVAMQLCPTAATTLRLPPNLVASASARGPETGDPEREETAHWEMVTAPHPPPEEGRVEYLGFVPPLARKPAVPKIHLRAVSSVSGSREGEGCELCITGLLPSSSLAAAGGCPRAPSCPFVEPGKGGSTPVPASSRHTSGCHKPQAGFLCFLPHEEESGECYIHTQTPPPAVTGQAVTGPGPGPCVPPRCPTAGTSVARWFRWHGVSEPG